MFACPTARSSFEPGGLYSILTGSYLQTDPAHSVVFYCGHAERRERLELFGMVVVP